LSNDEKRLAFVRQCVNGNGGIRWRGFTPTASELGALSYALRRSCTFDDPSHASGHVEYRGRKLLFEVGDNALTVKATDETLDPPAVPRMRPMTEMEKQRKAADRVVATEQHLEGFGR
jgi:hypothetical protein